MFQFSDGSEYEQGPISLEQPVGQLTVVDDARWSADLTSDSLGALAVWIVLLFALQAALWPLVRRVFNRFPDRGWGFGRLVTLLLAAYPIWLLASVEVIAFRAIWCGVALVAVAILGWAGWRFLPSRTEGDSTFVPWYRNRSILVSEGVFWAFFSLFLLFRFINPDSWHTRWGGEKPMELAHINAILRTAHFPPHDPWYADGLLNYYYYGMYLVAFLMKLTGIPSEIAFNLAQPTMIALLAGGAFSVGSALAGSIARGARWVIGGGLLAVLLVNLVGNLVAMSRVVAGIQGEPQQVNDYLYWVWNPREVVPQTINEFPYFTALYADLHAHVVALPMTVLVIGLCLAFVQDARGLALAVVRPWRRPGLTLNFLTRAGLAALALGSLYMTNAWDVPTYGALVFVSMLVATRALPALWERFAVATAVTLGIALVAYLIALPFSAHYVSRYGEIDQVRDVSPLYAIEGHFGVFLLAIAFGLSVLLSREWRNPALVCHPGVFTTLLLGLLLWRWYVADGSRAAIDLVDSLTVGLVTVWLLVALLISLPQRLDFSLPWIVVQVLAVASWIVVIVALVMDRIAFGLLFGLGATAGLMWLAEGSAGRRVTFSLIAAAMFVAAGVELVFLLDDLSGGDFYRMNTVFKFYNAVWVMAALASAALIVRMAREAGADGDSDARQAVLLPPDEAPGSLWHATAAVQDSSVPAGGGQVEHGARTAIPASYVTPVIADRTAEMQDSGPDHDVGTSPRGESDVDGRLVRQARSRRQWSTAWARVGLAVSVVAITAALAYPLIATGIRLDQRFPQDGRSWTLNALDWMSYGQIPRRGGVALSYDEDRAVIEWFNSEVSGTPVIAEASLGAYMCSGSRISIHTGLPVVVGWTWHETQQRGATDLYQRRADLETLYTSEDPEEKLRIIEKYRIEYIVVGDLERSYPGPDCTVTDNEAGIAAFRPLVGSKLEVAFQAGDTVVYRVTGA